jgi:hypothetical protein
VSDQRLLGGWPTCPAPANPTPYAHPGKDDGNKWKHHRTDVSALTTGSCVKEASGDDEEANRIEDEKGAQGEENNGECA